MQVTGATVVSPPHAYTGPAKRAADNDGDGRKGAAALNDGDAAARRANTAIAQSAHATSGSRSTSKSVDVKA